MSVGYDAGSTNEELLKLLRRMDGDFAWERFLATYQPMIRLCCQSSNLNHQEIDEVESMVMSKLLTFFRRTESRIKFSFRGFLSTLVQNEVCEFLRQKKRNTMISIDHIAIDSQISSISPQLASEFEELENQICQRVLLIQKSVEMVKSKIDEQTWQIFWDYAILDQRPEDVAKRYNVSVSAVFKYRQRISNKLKIAGDKLSRGLDVSNTDE
jgi:DNA-directed RNA polymerase specialized sigma24 family protein